MSVPGTHVVCHLNGASTPVFTDGRLYGAVRVKDLPSSRGRAPTDRLYMVRDDLGHERIIIPGERCPHLQRKLEEPGQRVPRSECVGFFAFASVR